MTMLERMARAQYDAWIADVQELEEPWDALPQSHRERLTDSLRAALQVLREPDAGMIEAGKNEQIQALHAGHSRNDRQSKGFTAMINYVLNEGDE